MSDTNGATSGVTRMAESTTQEAYGASRIGPFDYCPAAGVPS
jgi:hypothetical protein